MNRIQISLRSLCITAAIAVISGCASAPATVNGKLLPPDGKAYVILSTTYQIPLGNHINGESGVDLLQGDRKISVITTPENRRITSPDGKSEIKGGVHLITLQPGEYRISRVYGSYQESGFEFGIGVSTAKGHSGVGASAGTGPRRYYFAVPSKYTFEVKAGEVVYLGDAGIKLDSVPSATLKNESVRDLNHVRAIWKVSDFSNIQTRIASEKP